MNYASMARMAQSMLALPPSGSGMAIPSLRKGKGAYNPVTGGTASAADTACTYYGIQIPVTESYIDGKQRTYDDQFKTGTEIVALDAKILIAPNAYDDNNVVIADFKPQMGDVFTLPDGVFSVKTVEPLSPAGTPLLYEVGLVK
jgi:hypothetical protein